LLIEETDGDDDDDDDNEAKIGEDDVEWLRMKLLKGEEIEDYAEDKEDIDSDLEEHAEYGDRDMKAEDIDHGEEIDGENKMTENNDQETTLRTNHSVVTYEEKKALCFDENKEEMTEFTNGEEKTKYVDKNDHMTYADVEETRYAITEQTNEAKTGINMVEDANMLERDETSLEADDEVTENEELYKDNFVINFFNFH
jgi:hypothetical protein